VTGKLKPIAIYAGIARAYRQRALALLEIGAIIFVPLGLLDVLADKAGSIDLNQVGELATVALVAGLFAQALTGLLGEVFYSGAIAELVARTPVGERVSLDRLARTLAWGSLFLVDVVFGLAVAAGLLLLIVPGVVVFTYFALSAPLVELERLGFRRALGRSFRLVRGNFWRVLAVMGPVTLVSDALVNVAVGLSHGPFEHSLLASWAVDSAASILLTPLYALGAVLVTLELIRISGAETRV
jgi:hypothetical protein